MPLRKRFRSWFATLLLGVAGPAAMAGSQNALKVEIDATDYPDAKCNDGTPATYYVRGAGADGAISGRKWLISLEGGGGCNSDASCAERWFDPDGAPDGFIGFHGNMTASTARVINLDGQGILDFDGVDDWQPDPGTNPFVGFNRVKVPYCSSDSWSGRNTSPRTVDYGAYVGTTVDINGKMVAIANPAGFPPLTSIRFSGRAIVEALADLLMNGGLPSGKKTRAESDPVAAPPAAAEDEVVLAGSSAGGTGVVLNLDNVAHIVHRAAPDVKVYGVIDAATGALPEDNVNGDADFAEATFRGTASAAEVDTSCQMVHPITTSTQCFNAQTVLRSFIETPHYVVQTAYDGTIHKGFAEVLAQQLVQWVPASLADTLATQYVRNRVSVGVRDLGGGLTNREQLGYFIPNYATPKHQLIVEDVWFFNSPLAYTNHGGHDPRLGIDPHSPLGLPRSLACFRFKLTGQGSCVDTADAKVLNATYPTNPLSASYDAATATLTLPFVRLSNNSYFRNVSVVLNPLGNVLVGDPAVGAFPVVNEYSITTNMLKLPGVTVGDRVYQRVSVSGPGLRVLGYEQVQP